MTLLNRKNKRRNKSGITIIETLIYTAILAVALVIIVQMMNSIVKTHRLIKMKQSLEASGTISMERMLREIRNASSVDIINSTLNSSPGQLVLLGRDEDGNNYNLEFSLSSGAVTLAKNGGAPGPLSVPGITVDSLIFRKIANSVSDGVKVELSLSYIDGTETKSLDLFGFAVLRNSY